MTSMQTMDWSDIYYFLFWCCPGACIIIVCGTVGTFILSLPINLLNKEAHKNIYTKTMIFFYQIFLVITIIAAFSNYIDFSFEFLPRSIANRGLFIFIVLLLYGGINRSYKPGWWKPN